jgi:hypothetical protein
MTVLITGAAGTHLAPSLKVAEAAKVIENTQRDLNIALVNELAIIFRQMGIDTLDVLEAAGTKWNFLPFRPGLVGGHCIGVDPYYLTHKAEQLGYHPQVVLAGRRINDGMGAWVVEQLVRERARAGPELQGELPRSAQHPGGGSDRSPGALRHGGNGGGSLGESPGGPGGIRFRRAGRDPRWGALQRRSGRSGPPAICGSTS